MSQSPLARSSRRSLPAFAHVPSRLSKATSSRALDQDAEESPPRTPRKSGPATPLQADSAIRYRQAGTGVTPSTPKITYSPYATSTPPAQLSRSSSIPFDMAASARAGRRAEADARLRATEQMTAGPSGKRKKFIRRRSVLQRLWDLPQSLVDQVLLHTPTSMDELLPSSHLANPISLAIHFLHYLLLAPLFKEHDAPASVLRSGRTPTSVGSRWDMWEGERRWRGTGLGGIWFALLVTALLMAITAANSVYLFTRFRVYDLQLRSAQNPPASPHASSIPAPTVNPAEEDVFGHPAERASEQHNTLLITARLFLKLLRWSYGAILSLFGRQTGSSSSGAFAQGGDRIQALRVWDPPDFSLAFFCAFPPSAPLLAYLLTPLHPFLTPMLHLVISFLLSHLTTTHAQLVKDRMLLSAEVMREYDQRFVYQRIFGSRVDRGTQTHEAETLW